ncbi:TIGR03564 family F420-dependent LLM class oxidoreductase [Mycolicibacterium rufum]|uniref:TIGR03564 family F420-dependent LLM class oxidoreductase n=1 Tax=Mycolicibacterium rufum TaxID=318424 RepID=A0A9X2Y384_9MYCO|nr:TIGR03564 family F420-dependent LLM class oxidoreductase [Mycolicibacterium rufum]KGI69827.1 F420-dependent oxidoreductase [Mycolicibacterium rufum]MCV7073082.1 TIGR03564 family F420-dependent LLM class oxidoreductase [Mycolicibacterium rufum]ULP36072.1 TIGR03564 family F420-dependent LLM class oxidoreductase [Mycolicibacterium rufum]
MTTGVVLFARAGSGNAVDDIVTQARRADHLGTRHVWLAQQFDHDAVSLAGLIGAAVPGLGVGTSVVPFNPRHPLTLASQAQTAQAAAHGNFSLGLGLGAHEPERIAYGTAWPNTIARLREYLMILRSIFHTGGVDFHGEEFTAAPAWPTTLEGGTPVPVYVAAMGPKALAVTGELADGTLPYLAGPRTIEQFIEPTIARAAADAGRPRPRIIAFVPAQVTADEHAAREAANEQLAFYATIPSYQKVIAREGVESLAELAAIGEEDTVLRALRRYLDAGATDVVLSPLERDQPDEKLWQLAAAL